LPDGLKAIYPLETLSLAELALLVWLNEADDFAKGTWSNVSKQTLHRQFLSCCLGGAFGAEDASSAVLLHTAIQISTNALLDSEIAQNWQVRSATKDAVELVVQISRRFHQCARQLHNRHDARSTIAIKDEYDVQDLLHALLRLHFDDVRPEEWTPSYAGTSSRMDFLLKKERVIVETKMTRKNLGQKDVVNQLTEDAARYRQHPDCDALVCFVYDPEGRCFNPAALENDITKSVPGFPVRVVVAPQGF
jgi:hypothetical protein